MKKTIKPLVIDIDRDKISFCAPNHLEPLVFKLLPNMISDLELINPQELSVNLRLFFEQNKIKSGPVVLIFAQAVYFEKNYPGQNPPTPEDTDGFIETVPFSATSSRLFRVISGFKQVVINRDFYESLKNSLEEMGFQVTAVVPGFALGQSTNTGFTAETCRLIYKKMDQIIADSIIGTKENTTVSLHEKEQAMLEGHKILVIVAILLVMAVCGFALYMTFGRVPPKKIVTRPIIVTQAQPTETPIPTPTPEETASLSPEELKNLSVQILNASGKIGQAASMSESLKSLGFEKIQIGNNPKTVTSTTLYLSSRVATAAGDLVFDSVKSLYPYANSQTDLEAKYDITVIIGTNTP